LLEESADFRPAWADAKRGSVLSISRGDLQGRILVADDVPDAATSLAMLCEMYGADVRQAHDGEQTVEAAASFRPDVVLMDITMPKMDGYAAARAIRMEEWGRTMILIALTGWGRKTDHDAAMAAGFDGHLLKPVEPDALLDLIAKLRSERANGDSR
jgi:CheY-like chemotaxis protein